MISELNVLLRGWMSYFRLTEVKGVLDDLDGWLRRKLKGVNGPAGRLAAAFSISDGLARN